MANFHRISKKFSENLTLLLFKTLTVRIFATAHIARPLQIIPHIQKMELISSANVLTDYRRKNQAEFGKFWGIDNQSFNKR